MGKMYWGSGTAVGKIMSRAGPGPLAKGTSDFALVVCVRTHLLLPLPQMKILNPPLSC